MSNQVIIQNAVKRYGDFTALNGVSLDIQEGEFFTLLGPSGCGKTTLLRMIAGFNSIEGGDFYFGEKRINDVPAHKRDIGMVFQNYAIFPHLTVRENVAYGLKARKMPVKEIKPKVDEALELVQISHLADRKPNELSGGQQQRVALARAFVIEPSVLLMDEPLSNLDAKLRVQMRSVIKKLQRRLGITTIYVTHDQEEALTMSDTIVVMNEGVIQQIGTPADIYNEPKNVFVAKFIGESNIIPGVMLEDYKVRFHDIDFECVDAGFGCNTPVDVVVRPEDIDIMPLGKTALKGTIKSVLFMGVHYEFRIETGSFTWTVHSTDYVAPDTEISLEIVPDAIHIMHKSLKHDEQELLTEDEIADAAAAAEEE